MNLLGLGHFHPENEITNSFLESLDIVRTVLDNRLMAKVLGEVRTRILEGADIATPLKKSGVFPPVVGYMVAVGEQTSRPARVALPIDSMADSDDVGPMRAS